MSHKFYGVNELREMFLSFFESNGHLLSLIHISASKRPTSPTILRPFIFWMPTAAVILPPKRSCCTSW